MKKCSLCTELKNQNNNIAVYFKDYSLDSRIIAKNEIFCLFPTLGCFVKGYLLLSTIEHYISLYNCPNNIVEHVSVTIEYLREVYKEKLNTGMIFFEHGTVDDYGLSSASVSHFHMHFLPIQESIWEYINSEYKFEFYKLPKITDLKEFIDKYKISSYLLFGDYNSDIYIIDCSDKGYPSQFLRKVCYKYYYGESEDRWDWKKYPFKKMLWETVELFDGVAI